MTVFIVVNTAWNTIESVWDTMDAANKARREHAIKGSTKTAYYTVVIRVVNKMEVEKKENE